MRKLKKLKKEPRTFIFTSAFLGIVFIIFLIVSLCLKMYGLVVGWTIGLAITLVSMFLLFKSGELMQRNATSDNPKGTGLVILFYASRFLLYAAGLVICALFGMKFKVPQFEHSLWTCLAALLPTHIFIAIFYHDDDDKVKENKPVENKITNKIGENDKK